MSRFHALPLVDTPGTERLAAPPTPAESRGSSSRTDDGIGIWNIVQEKQDSTG